MTTTALAYSTTEINRSFKIKVSGINGDGKRINSLFGVSGLVTLIGIELTNKFVSRAFENAFYEDSTVCKLRRGLKVTFYNI